MKQLLKLIEELSESILHKYEIGLETPMKVGDFICDCVNLIVLQMSLDKIQIMVNHIQIILIG